MLNCEGYKMFDGSALITPKTGCVEPFRLNGTWLYRPDTCCWYIKGHSFAESIVSDIQEDK